MIRSYYLKGGRNKRASKRAARIGKKSQLYRNPKKEDVHFEKEYCGQNKLNIMISDIAFSDNMTLDLGGITAQIFHTVSPHSDDTTCERRVALLFGKYTLIVFLLQSLAFNVVRIENQMNKR